MFFQLTYKSEAQSNLKIEDLEAILSTSRNFNSKENITGCLIYTNKIFIQILEGEKKVVKELYERIKKDSRHFNVTLIDESVADQRHFSKWAMAYLKPSDVVVGPKGEEVRLALQKMNESSLEPGIELNRFWNNISVLLTDAGYYQD